MEPRRKPIVAANWKMHKTAAEAEQFLDVFLPLVEAEQGTEIVICPSFLALATVVQGCRVGTVKVAGQNMHHEPEGAFTGEISAPMLVDAGAAAVVLGHSERRALFGETDRELRRKVPVALSAGLLPILCVGESEAQREGKDTEEVLRRQLTEDLADVASDRLAEIVIAYEPVWAIGTGKTATPEIAEETIGFCRSILAGIDEAAAARVRILYGGSVKPENAAELLGREEIDGALVGGASLDPRAFGEIVRAA